MGTRDDKNTGQINPLWLIPLLLCIGFGAYLLTVSAIPKGEQRDPGGGSSEARQPPHDGRNPEEKKIHTPADVR